MTEYLGALSRVKLFSGLSGDEILSALNCLRAKVKSYNRGSAVYSDGDEVKFVGVILSGELVTQKIDYNGNSNIISKLYPTDIIAASVCYSTLRRIPFEVMCVSDCDVLALDITALVQTCGNACFLHTRLIKNMLNIIADRNIMLAGKIDILTKRSIKEKVLAYLYAESKRANSRKFTVTMSRRQMAEFLSINRSALSRELSELQNEGVINFDKNSFYLK